MIPPSSPQHTNTGLEEEFLHIQRWAKENKLKINYLKTKEIVFEGPSSDIMYHLHPFFK